MEHKNDYNVPIHGRGGGFARQINKTFFTSKSYDEFDLDPLASILNSFSKIDREGENAAIQLIFNHRQDELVKRAVRRLKIRKGEKLVRSWRN